MKPTLRSGRIRPRRSTTIHHYAQVEAIRSIIEQGPHPATSDSRYDQYLRHLYSLQAEFHQGNVQDSATLFIMGDALNRLGQVEQATVQCWNHPPGKIPSYKEQALLSCSSPSMSNSGKYQEALIWNTLYLSYLSHRQRMLEIMRRQAWRGAVQARKPQCSPCPISKPRPTADSLLALQFACLTLRMPTGRLGLPQQKQHDPGQRSSAFHHGKRVSPIIEEALYLQGEPGEKGQGDFARGYHLSSRSFWMPTPSRPMPSWAMYYLSQT
ncbi:MAG: hypothetical protein MZU91_03035 [Desulfosudis oleivorans]|nr:hypothetical protein [Desulfosudis oleivorans]